MHEAGKTLADAVGELREAVDFLRYYAAQIANHQGTPRGIFTCVSPWNFPLAIFTGQIAAALAAGNGVLAKPAETTSAIAAWAIARLHRAGVPKTSLQLVLGNRGPKLATRSARIQKFLALHLRDQPKQPRSFKTEWPKCANLVRR